MSWVIMGALIISVLLNIVQAIIVRRGSQYIDILENLSDSVIERLIETQSGVASAVDQMRAIDLQGAFEANDIVGTTFKDLLKIVNSLEPYLQEIVVDTRAENEK